MKRNIENYLLKWKQNPDRKPLLVRGARQVGKTFSIKKFGSEQYRNLVVIDFEKQVNLHPIFSKNLDPQKIIEQLSLVLNVKISTQDTLLFFDEIQACPRAIMSLRYFYEEMPELHIIAAGSLLEFALIDISFPVGRLQLLDVYPLTFAEYLTAIGKEQLAEIVLSPPQEQPLVIHDLLIEELKTFFIVGGFPESVKIYAQTGSLHSSQEVLHDIAQTYQSDFSKYRPRTDPDCIRSVFEAVAKNVARQIKYTNLATDYSEPTIKKTFHLLNLAKVVTKVPSASPSGLPLGASASAKIFKAIMVDIGLMQSLCGLTKSSDYLTADLLDMHKGAVAEQFVGQELMASQEQGLFYWARREKSSLSEVDYLAVVNGDIVPIEVKNKALGHLKSLHICLQTYKNCKHAFVFSTQAYRQASEKIFYIPLYYAFSVTGGAKERFFQR